MTTFWNRAWPPLVLLTLLFAAWEIGARAAASPNVPPFSAVVGALYVQLGDISVQIVTTLRRAMTGLALAIFTMVPLGIVIGKSKVLSELLEPCINLLRPLPPPALAPLVVLFAGTGDAAKVSIIFYTAAFPILINAIDGIRGTHPLLHTVSRSLRLSRVESFWNVDLPATLPVIMTGIRLAVAASLLVSVTAEMLLSTNGIGVYLLQKQETFQIAASLAGIFAIAVVGWLINAAFLRLDKRLLYWHQATTAA